MVVSRLSLFSRSSRHLVPAALVYTLGACSSSAPPFDAAAVVQEWVNYMQSDYVLRPGDRFAVTVYPPGPDTDELAQELVVSPRGTVSLERIPQEFRGAEKSISQFRNEIQEAYSGIIQNAEVSITLLDVSTRSVYVAGEVESAGVVPYLSGMLLSQAVSEAGGLNILANWNDVRVLRNTAGRTRTFRVNLSAILYESAPDFPLLPGDVVFCQTSAIADVGNWVELYIRRLLPIPIPIYY